MDNVFDEMSAELMKTINLDAILGMDEIMFKCLICAIVDIYDFTHKEFDAIPAFMEMQKMAVAMRELDKQ